MSKAFNMTGWRLAWICGNALVVRAFADVKDNFDSGQFKAIQKAAMYALQHPEITLEIAEIQPAFRYAVPDPECRRLPRQKAGRVFLPLCAGAAWYRRGTALCEWGGFLSVPHPREINLYCPLG